MSKGLDRSNKQGEDEDLAYLRADIQDKGTTPVDYYVLVELHAVRRFLIKKGIPSPALDRLYLELDTKLRKATAGNNALSTQEVIWRGMVVGAVLFLQEQGATLEEARAQVAKASGEDYAEVRKWQRAVQQSQLRVKKGEYALTVQNQAQEALMWVKTEYQRKHNQLTPEAMIAAMLARD